MTTKLLDARSAIYDRFRTLWDPADGPIGFDNVDQAPPPSGPWVRLFVRVQAKDIEGLAGVGNSAWRQVGTIMVQVFVPRNDGVKRADELAQKITAIFQGREFGGVRCYATTPRDVGISQLWHQMNVDTFFDFDEIG